MKKILLGLGSLVSVIAPVAAVVSCGTKAAPTTPAPAAQPAAQTTNTDGGNAAGGTQHNSGGSHHDSNFVPTVATETPTINRNPVAEPTTYPVNMHGETTDVSTWGTVWLATFYHGWTMKFSGSSYNDILDNVLNHYKNEQFAKFDGLLRKNKDDKWAIWDIPNDHGDTVAKLAEIGITTDGQGSQYCFDSADDAIAYIRGLSNDLKAKLFNSLV